MKPSFLRLLLSLFLMIAIPLQGLAASGMSLGTQSPCGMSEVEMLQMQAMHDAAQAQSPTQNDSTSQPDNTKMPCSHCSPCWAACTFAVVGAGQTLRLDITAQRQRFPDLIQTLPNAPVHTLERPPRA